MLNRYDEFKPLLFACDALPHGSIKVLSHQIPDGREASIAYFISISLEEWDHAQIDKEAFAMVTGVKKFHDYVYGW